MDWLRLKLTEAIGTKQPLNKKVVLAFAAIVALIAFLINGAVSNAGQKVALAEPSVELQSDQVAVLPATIFVHVVGEVLDPGIYQLESGSRVVDAIFAAGGITKTADQNSVNLAREISDGEQIIVFKLGADGESLASGFSGGSLGESSGGLISLNRASSLELEALPGVGPALAGRIVDWRSANGGFKKKEDLLNISGIGDKLFAGIKDQVTL
jgi:competence protein ComEA